MHHFKIIYKPKQRVVFDTSALDEKSKEAYADVLTDASRADSYARKWMKQAEVNPDNYQVSTWEEKELNPNEKQKIIIDRIIKSYNEIYVDLDEWGRKVRRYNDNVKMIALLSDITFLRLYFPHFQFTNHYGAHWICNFNKVKNWGTLKMPHI